MKAAAAVLLLTGCTSLAEPHYSIDILQQDANSCAANPNSLPGCVVGFMAYIRWKF